MQLSASQLEVSRSEGTIEYCRMHDITLQAWGPLAGGTVTGRLPTDPDPRFRETAALVATLAEAYGVSREAILIAWLLRHPAGIQPVIGTTNPQRIAGCCEAIDVAMSRVDWYRLLEAGRGARVP